MAKGTETTTKFRVDISELKAGVQEANRQIALANSEFKKASAGMQSWSKDADGLSAKLRQLETVTGNYESILAELQKQYAKVVEEQGENSKGATDLKIKMNALEGAIKGNQAQMGRYADQLKEITAQQNQSNTANMVSDYERLQQIISQQEGVLTSLKSKYAAVALEQGQSSTEAKRLSSEIRELSGELSDNKGKLSQAESAADGFDQTLKDAGQAAEVASDGFSIMKGALADLVADGIRGVASELENMVLESESAYKSFQAQTGASANEMKEFKGVMDDLYSNAYGDNLQDIGDKMAYIKQVTGEVDPSKLEKLTENAMLLEDSMGADFNETIRGVQNLMTHFGIDSEKAFDLYAKGIQEGLNYTDELGDNIAEYGGNFAQAGYSAEEYFELLNNGAENGAYNLDKVNDSINEVKNRLGDGSIKKNITMFSKETQNAFKAWESGEGTMKNVIDSIVKDIVNCTDEQKALTLAAEAFGTMGEDANLKVVRSLQAAGSTFKDVGGTMQGIKDIKYEDVGVQFEMLGRKAKQELLQPLMAEVLPGLKNFVEYASTNFDALIPALETVGAALLGAFAVKKIADFTGAIKTLFTLMSANPVGILVTAFGTLTGAMLAYEKHQDAVIEREYGLTKVQKETNQRILEGKEAYDRMNEARQEAMGKVEAEYGYVEKLKDELNGLIGSNHKVKKGYEDRANFIVNELSKALGIEKEEIQEIIEKNGELGASIDKVIEKKKAEALLSANDAAYKEAIANQTTALKDYQLALAQVEEAEKKNVEAQTAKNKVMDEYKQRLITSPSTAEAYLSANADVVESAETTENAFNKSKEALRAAEEKYVGYNTTIQNYEGLSSAIISGESAKITEAMMNVQNSFITAENGTKESLQRQVANMRLNYEALKEAVMNGTPGVTQEMVNSAKTMVDKADEELSKFNEKGKMRGREGAEGLTSGFQTKSPDFIKEAEIVGTKWNEELMRFEPVFQKSGKKSGDAVNKGLSSTKNANTQTAKDIANSTNKGLGSANTNVTGKKKGQEYSSGVKSQTGAAENAGRSASSATNKGLGSANTRQTGSQKVNEFASPIRGYNMYSVGRSVAEKGRDGLSSVDTGSAGNNFVNGFANAIRRGGSSIWNIAWDLGKKALSALNSAINAHSPSRLTTESGEFFGQGFVNGIASWVKKGVTEAKKLGSDAIGALNDSVESVPVSIQNGKAALSQGVRHAARSGATGAQGNGPTIINNYFTQNNTSPKALSRLDIYRQSKNLLAMGRG